MQETTLQQALSWHRAAAEELVFFPMGSSQWVRLPAVCTASTRLLYMQALTGSSNGALAAHFRKEWWIRQE